MSIDHPHSGGEDKWLCLRTLASMISQRDETSYLIREGEEPILVTNDKELLFEKLTATSQIQIWKNGKPTGVILGSDMRAVAF